MTTMIRDFQSRERTNTSSTLEAAIGLDVPTMNRRGSAVSSISHVSTLDGHPRRRHRSRSNTVRTYGESAEEHWEPGAEPGIDTSAKDERLPPHLTNLKANCDINIIDFSDSNVQLARAGNDTLEEALTQPRPEALPCRWISVNGLSWDVIRLLGNRFGLHRLAIEDLIYTHSRTKVDWYKDQAFVVLTLSKLARIHLHDAGDCPAKYDDLESNDSNEKQSYFKRSKKPVKKPVDRFGTVDEFIRAHSSTSEESPVKDIRTLHRYESASVPDHTHFMEKHSALASEDLVVSVEQVAIFLLADNTVISFFEHSAEDIERPILQRLTSPETMLRRSQDASLLLQAIIDAIVDLAMPVRDAFNKARKELQIDAMTNPNIRTSRKLHIFGEEIDMLQNLFKPIVHLVNALRDHQLDPNANNTPPGSESPPSGPEGGSRVERMRRDAMGTPKFARSLSDYRRAPSKRAPGAASVGISPLAHTYFGDVLDHCITIIQAFEQMDASANNISTLVFNTVSARTNNFLMIFTIVTVFFAPLTFISGYFGMNFDNGDGLDHPFAFFWVVAIPALVGFMIIVAALALWDQIMDYFQKLYISIRRERRRRRS
ncbi:hypothetical protein AMS68_000793 [Peltaster fructicola]|uniref:Uncharacterized protein n=1 Tax=Peltaster fructicola TaxID=286661 RepID=A0A6H0XKP2_9PEZI|nr:hypothetical protein AMS68_000793 [Peltaster fructicola]